MTKSELILSITNRFPALTHSDTVISVQMILDCISDQLSHAERIEIRGFGSFAVYTRKARIGRNPKTGEIVQISAKRAIRFKPGMDLKITVNDHD